MRITLYLLSSGSPIDITALRSGSGFKPVTTKPLPGVTSSLFVKATPPGEAKWVKELRGLVSDDSGLSNLNTMSSAAVLLVKQGTNVFAVAFGGGFQAIDPAKIQRGFGLRVTANAIAGSKVKSADTRGLDREGRSQKVIAPVATELAALGIETHKEWVRQLSGSVTDVTFAKSAAGADSLRLTIKDFSLTKLPDKLKAITKLHTATAYKAKFGFLDNFTQLDPKDPVAIKLDAEVQKQVLAGNKDIFFAAPDPFEQLPVDTYKLTRSKSQEIEELTQEEVYAALAKLDLTVTDPLRKVTVTAMDSDGKSLDKSYKLYDYIQAEIKDANDDKYVLSAGRWFRVAKDYVEEVKAELARILEITDELDLPPW